MAANSTNKDIDYIQKDFDSSVDAMISFANINYGPGTSANRLWTSFNSDSFSRNWLEIVAFIADTLFFYFDVQATQSYLQTATVQSAIKDIAKQFGFTPATASSASGNAVFTTTGAVNIPRGFRVSSTNGQQFFLTTGIVAGAAGEFTGNVLQGTIKVDNNTAQGLQNEEFNLSAIDVIRDLTNSNPLDISPQITVNGNAYTLVTSFIRFNGTDVAPVFDSLGNVLGGGGRVFTLEERSDGTEYVKFGDGIFGRKLNPGDNVTITYRIGGGSAGNIPESTLVQLSDSLSNVSAVNNPSDFSGGADEQSIEQLRELIPASLRTLDRAVAEQDYSDILIANFSEVFAASTEKNTDDPGVDINIYVVPQGTGITNITDNNLLSNRLSSFLERRKMVTIQFQLLDAFGIEALISLEVFISDTASRTTVGNAITTLIQEFFDLSTGGPSGAGVGFAEDILLKDIGDLVQQVDGVVRFEIERLTYRPRVDKQIIGLTTEYQTSEVSIFPTINELEWLIGAAGPVQEAAGTILYDNTGLITYTYDPVTGKITYGSEVDISGAAVGDLFTTGVGAIEESEITVLDDGSGKAEKSLITTVPDIQGIEESTDITTLAATDLGGTFFTMRDLAGSVAVWFNVDSLDTEPPHGANRSLEVGLVAADADTAVATKLQAVIDGDSEFDASVASAIVSVDTADKGDFPDIVDGSVATGFTFAVTQQGLAVDTLDGTYFILDDDSGSVAFWIDVDDDGTAIPAGASAADRAVEITTITSNMSSNAVATQVQLAVDGDSKFSASVSTNEVTITDDSVGTRTDIADGNPATGFTFETTEQGADAISIGGKYWLLNAPGDSAVYYVWYDTGSSTDPVPAATSAGIQVVINPADSATAVASATAAAIDTFNLAEMLRIKVTTGASLNGRYFTLYDSAGSVAFWFDVSGSAVEPDHGADRAIEITTVGVVDSADTVASKVQVAIDGDSEFSSSVDTGTDPDEVLVTAFSSYLPDPTTGTSGFTIIVEQQGADFTSSSAVDVVTVTNPVVGTTTDTRDGDSSFTFVTTTQGTDDQAQLTLLGVENITNSIYVPTGLQISTTIGSSVNGRITNSASEFQSFKCFKKILARSTNLSASSITDNNLDLSVLRSTGSALSARVLLDNSKIFITNQYVGDFYLVDGANNIWEIVSNTSNTITTGITAVNDAAISQLANGAYKIVAKLVGSEILFNSSRFSIQFNSDNTIFSTGAQFPQIGTIGDSFEISEEQSNVGNLGTSVDVVAFDDTTGVVTLNGAPNLSGVTNEHRLIDSSGQVFNIIATDGRSNPFVEYSNTNQSNEVILEDSGTDSQFGQGFQVTTTNVYTVLSAHLRKEGNIVGNLVARIVEDDGGLPDLTKLVAISRSVVVTDVSETTEKVLFSFATPPELSAGTQYHLVINGDAGYSSSQDDGTATFSNTGLVGYTYAASTSTTGVVSYSSSVDLSGVLPGNFFKDNTGKFFKILVVDNILKTLTIVISVTDVPDEIATGVGDASCFAKDNIYIALDDISPSYADGIMTTFDGVSTWSAYGSSDMIFTIEGPKTVTIDSNLIPELGDGGTISTRYFDDENQLSVVIGVSNGTVAYATDVNAFGKGTIGAVPNSKVDRFIFRTSRFADDIVNLRLNEIPQINEEDITLNIFGGIE